MSLREADNTVQSAAGGASPPRTAALTLGVAAVVVLTTVAIGRLLLPGPLLDPVGGTHAAFRRQAYSILDSYDALIAETNRLFAERQQNAAAPSDPAWRKRFDDAISRADSLQAEADALVPENSDREVADKLSEGLRLYATGLALLRDGYQTDGHGAYYYGSHGNWDLNLAATRLREARTLLNSR